MHKKHLFAFIFVGRGGGGGGSSVRIPNHNSLSITFRRGKDLFIFSILPCVLNWYFVRVRFVLLSRISLVGHFISLSLGLFIYYIHVLIIELHNLHAKCCKKVLLVCMFDSFKDNSLKEWSFKSAITVQTYNGYDPIPVPFNIIYRVAKLLRLVKKKEQEEVQVNGDGAKVRALAFH